MRKVTGLVLVIVLILMCIGCGNQTSTVVNVEEEQEPVVVEKYIDIVAIGDNLLHMPVVNSGRKDDGTYEYSHLFEKLQPMIKDADVAVIGQETIFGGKEKGYSGYPMFNSPSDMGVSLVNEGFDVVLHASNHVMDKGTNGIRNTINFWKDYPEVTVLGIHETEEESKEIDIIEKEGAKIALLNYTYSTNGITVPADEYYMVEQINEENIENDVKYAEDNADFTIAFMHWGTEYQTSPDENQKALAKRMCEWGVDLIIGSHPHVIEPAEWIESENGNKMFVYYSLGNYVSRQLNAINLLGGAANVTLKVDDSGVSLVKNEFMPVVTHYDVTHTKFSVYPLKDYNDELASAHGLNGRDGKISVERWKEMVDKVFAEYDSSVIDY